MSQAFQGKQIFLRPFEPSDAESVREYLNYPDLTGRRYLPHGFTDELLLSQKQVDEIIVRWGRTENRVHLAVILREGDTLIGHAAAYWGWDPHCPGIDLVISPAYQRQGLGSEVMTLLVQWLFDTMPAHNIGIEVTDWNEPAQNFLKNHGFQEAGRSRREGMREGKFYDLLLFDLLRREWKRSV